VAIALERNARQVEIKVAGCGKPYRSVSACAPSCLIDMAPSINPMFVMTRHYDFVAGGEQEFLWAGHRERRRPTAALCFADAFSDDDPRNGR